VFGWLVVAALLFGGVGALIYVAFGERDAASKTDAASLHGSTSPEVVPAPTVAPGSAGSAGSDRAAPAAAQQAAAAEDGSGALGSGADAKHTAAPEPDAVTGSGGDDKRPGRHTTHPGTGSNGHHVATAPPAGGSDDKTVQAMVARAKAFEKDGRSADARAMYQKLEKSPHYNQGEALYHQAWIAFQQNATADAAELAAKAAAIPGPFKTQAQSLYADVWYRQGDYARAKVLYGMLRKSVSGEERTNVDKKIVRCNKQLKLPDADGLSPD
jgi:tetratricopeptide (TPR) repeat protein